MSRLDELEAAGKVTVDGVDLLGLSTAEMTLYQRKKVGFVWQQTSRNLIPYLTAQENIELPMTMAWVSSRKSKQAWSCELLNAVGLYERRTHRLLVSQVQPYRAYLGLVDNLMGRKFHGNWVSDLLRQFDRLLGAGGHGSLHKRQIHCAEDGMGLLRRKPA